MKELVIFLIILGIAFSVSSFVYSPPAVGEPEIVDIEIPPVYECEDAMLYDVNVTIVNNGNETADIYIETEGGGRVGIISSVKSNERRTIKGKVVLECSGKAGTTKELKLKACSGNQFGEYCSQFYTKSYVLQEEKEQGQLCAGVAFLLLTVGFFIRNNKN